MAFRLPRRVLFFIVSLTLCFAVLHLSARPVRAEGAVNTHVYGRVVDNATHQFISEARVFLWNRASRDRFTTETNTSGFYEVKAIDRGSYEVYVYHDNSSTEGVDYVPAHRRRDVGETAINVSFRLLPGASIRAEGEFRPFGSPPVERVSFTVVDQHGLLQGTDAVTEYGDRGRTIVVPAYVPFKVVAWVRYEDDTQRNFVIDKEGDYLNLAQGDLLTVNLWHIMLRNVVLTNEMRNLLSSVQGMAYEAEETGFYVSYEGIKLSRAEDLVETAYSAWDEGDYEKTYADFHEAYLILEDLGRALTGMHANATQSAFFITPLLGFTAVALASVLLDDRRKRLVLGLAFYGILFGLLYFLYPGYRTLEKTVQSLWAGTALEALATPLLVTGPFLLAFLGVNWLPHVFKEKTAAERLALAGALTAAFSVAARNLRRRRLRTLLSSTFILVLVFSFIALTSLSPEHGLRIQPQPGQAPSEGFLIRKPPTDELLAPPFLSSPFEPIELSLPQWLENRPEVTLVAPLMENTPQVGEDGPPPPLTSLTAPQESLKFDVTGVLGVSPSREAEATRLDSVITQGRFLNDTDFNGILISEEAAEELHVEANDTVELYGQLFSVTGVFSSEKLGGLKDWNGEPLVPQRVIMYTNDIPEYLIEYVPIGGVVIIHQQTAQSLPEMVISRVAVQTGSPEAAMDLARMTVLAWSNVEAFAYADGKIYHLSIGSYYMAEGFGHVVVLLALAVLNVGVTMMGAVYERKREVVTMSCVGLNPSNITAVFLAEALVIGVVAGSLGYLLGLVSYRFMITFAVSIGMKQKVEAGWGILALGLSIAAAAVGSALPAAKASIVTTPSLLRKFDITPEEKPRTAGEPWLFNLPIQIREEDLEGFFGFVEKRLLDYTRFTLEGVRDVKLFREGKAEHTATRLAFTYFYLDYAVVTDNEMFPIEGPIPNQYTIRLASKTRRGATTQRDEVDVRRTASLIRHLTLEYTIKGEKPGKSTPSNQD